MRVAWNTCRSILNGALGDYLSERQNGLAIDMAFYHAGRPLALTPASLASVYPTLTGRLCILVHGLGCHEGVWAFRQIGQDPEDRSYGTLLQAECGYTPFYLRYNSGLHISQNGRSLARLLDQLLDNYPLPVEEILLIGHSMGGLVLRSACHYGAEADAAWTAKVTRVVYLGTPHDGAYLEQLGHATAAILQAVPHPVTRLVGRIANLRSQGIQDLRYGSLVDEDWAGGVTGIGHDPRQPIPWLTTARHYLAVGTLAEDPESSVNALLGDALVWASHAHGPSWREQGAHADDHVQRFPQVHHLALARHPAVYEQIKLWCTQDEEG